MRLPERRPITWRDTSLEQMLDDNHVVRTIWTYVDSLDLSTLYENIKAVEGGVGRDAVDPRILLALWMFATIEGISSARQLDRLCTRDIPYMWICGDVGVNDHLLSDFRSNQADFMDELLTATVASLMSQGLVTLNMVAQDGMRVRASAGTDSFRRGETLQKHHDAAKAQVERLRAEAEGESGQSGRSESQTQAARQRAADEKLERIELALKELEKLQQQKEKRKKGTDKKARCSTTDPQARVMKMGDGGFRPAYNVQFATDGDARIIVGVDLTNSGSDRGQMGPMQTQISERYGMVPKRYLVDCGFATKDDITSAELAGSMVYAPIHGEAKMLKDGNDPYERKKTDSDAMFAFRQRMKTEPAKDRYKKRAPIAEFPNALCRNHGLHQFRVRGQARARAVSLLHALVINFQRALTMGWLNHTLQTG